MLMQNGRTCPRLRDLQPVGSGGFVGRSSYKVRGSEALSEADSKATVRVSSDGTEGEADLPRCMSGITEVRASRDSKYTTYVHTTSTSMHGQDHRS
jgi:hypothetical protein